MGTYVTSLGLQIPALQELLDKTAEDQRSTIDPNLPTDPDTPTGQLNGIFCNALRTAWEALDIAWNGNNPDAAEGFLLACISAITGTKKSPATSSKFSGTFQVLVNLNANTTLPANAGAAQLGNPTVSFHTIVDFTSPNVGPANYLIDMICDQTGPVVCNAGTLTVITTPIVGWNSVTNPFDAIVGTNEDNDAQLRYRRESELRATGKSTLDSIRAELLAITFTDGSQPVTQAIIFENVSEITDGNGLPGHSLRCLVYDGINAIVPNNTIAQTIWNSKPGGIELTGNTAGSAVDALGNARTIPFSRPAIAEIKMFCTLTLTDMGQTAAQYATVVQAALAAEFLKKVRVGSVIRVRHYEGIVTDIPGIDDCVILLGRVGFAYLAQDTNLPLDAFEMGDAQTPNITVQ